MKYLNSFLQLILPSNRNKRKTIPYRLLLISLLLNIQCSDVFDDDIDKIDDSQKQFKYQGSVVGPIGTQVLSSNQSNLNFSENKKETKIIGAEVKIFEINEFLENGIKTEPILSTKTDNNGNYSIENISSELNFIIIVETNPRLSTLVLNKEKNDNLNINSSTTLTSEFFGQKLNERVPNESEYKAILQRAEFILNELEQEQLFTVISELIPENFGEKFPQEISDISQQVLEYLYGITIANCIDLQLSSNTGFPGTTLNISGLGSNFGKDPYILFFTEDQTNYLEIEEAFPIYLDITEEGTVEFIVPVNPLDPFLKTDVKIVVMSEDKTLICDPIPFTIEALEKKGDLLKTMVMDLEETFDHLINIFGYDPKILENADLNDLNNEAMVLAYTKKYIDSQYKPNNLKNFAEGIYEIDGKAEQLGSEELDFIGGIYFSTGIYQIFKELKEEVLSLNFEENANSKLNKRINFAAEDTYFTPEQLNLRMEAQEYFKKMADALGKASRNMTAAAIGATLINPKFGGVVGLKATELTLQKISAELFENLLPSNLSHIKVDASPKHYKNEDDDTKGEWSSELFAKNNGYKLNIADLINALPVWGKVTGKVAKFEIFNKFSEAIVERAVNVSQQLSADLFSELSVKLDKNQYEIPSEYFITPIDINRPNEKKYFKWEIQMEESERPGNPFVFQQNDETKYIPNQVGKSRIQVETTGGNVFQGQVVYGNELLILDKINIIISPTTSVLRAEIEENISLSSIVENAIDKSVEWRVVSASGGYMTSGNLESKEITFTPFEGGDYVIEVESKSRKGARTNNEPPRIASIVIRVDDELKVNTPSCLKINENFQFNAFLGNNQLDFRELYWTIIGPGELDINGNFSAASEGEVTIVFSYEDQAGIVSSTEITFEVRKSCGTEYEILISGDYLSGSYTGTVATSRNIFDNWGENSTSTIPERHFVLAEFFKGFRIPAYFDMLEDQNEIEFDWSEFEPESSIGLSFIYLPNLFLTGTGFWMDGDRNSVYVPYGNSWRIKGFGTIGSYWFTGSHSYYITDAQVENFETYYRLIPVINTVERTYSGTVIISAVIWQEENENYDSECVKESIIGLIPCNVFLANMTIKLKVPPPINDGSQTVDWIKD